jgi:hypothetical protein
MKLSEGDPVTCMLVSGLDKGIEPSCFSVVVHGTDRSLLSRVALESPREQNLSKWRILQAYCFPEHCRTSPGNHLRP